MPLGTLGGGKYLDLDLAAAGNTEVVRAKMRTMHSLNLNDTIEDILITLGKQYHLIRLLANADGTQSLFLYFALDRSKANLALARHHLKRIENQLQNSRARTSLTGKNFVSLGQPATAGLAGRAAPLLISISRVAGAGRRPPAPRR